MSKNMKDLTKMSDFGGKNSKILQICPNIDEVFKKTFISSQSEIHLSIGILWALAISFYQTNNNSTIYIYLMFFN